MPAEEYLPAYLVSIQPGGKAVYRLLLLLILGILASLPLVKVQVTVSGRGIIRPLQERTRILATSSGTVSKVYVREGDRVENLEPLLQIRSVESLLEEDILRTELFETRGYVEDLEGLTSLPQVLPRSKKYRGEYEEYRKRTEYLELIHARADRELTRHQGLYEGGLISQKEYEDLRFEAERAQKELEGHKVKALSTWQGEYHRQLEHLRDLKIRARTAEEKLLLRTVRAPATGSLVEFDGILEGSAVQSGSVLGILSPDTGLIGEFYVPSSQMAFLHHSQRVHLLMDAFRAREWGLLPGEIYEISGDFILMENQPVYRIKCRLEQDELRLKNGYAAKIRKGMTFQAICLVNKRSLLQLLSDRAGDWLNPSRKGKFTQLPASP